MILTNEVNMELMKLFLIVQDLKNIKNVKRCRDGMPKSMRTR